MNRSIATRGGIVAVIAVAGIIAAATFTAPGANADDAPQDRAARAEFGRIQPVDDTTATRSGASRAALAPGQNIEFVALSPSCRMADTRNGGGKLAAGAPRDLTAISLSGQGAPGSTCPVPPNAVAVDVSLSTIANTPTGTGYVQVGPAFSAPSATVLQFLKNQGTSVTTTIPLEVGGIRVKANGAGTHLAIDVLGYWQNALHASVRPDGDDPDVVPEVIVHSGLTGIGAHDTIPGLYFLEFDRDISGCSVAATPESFDDAFITRVSAGIGVDVDGSFVAVDVRDYASEADVEGAFELIVEC